MVVLRPRTRKLKSKIRSNIQNNNVDNDFYNNEFWHEEENDSEWSFVESDSGSDVFDSDFSDVSADSDTPEVDEAYKARQQAKKKKQKFFYEKVAARNIKKQLLQSRNWSLLTHPVQLAGGVKLTQKAMLARAAIVENDNTANYKRYLEKMRDANQSVNKVEYVVQPSIVTHRFISKLIEHNNQIQEHQELSAKVRKTPSMKKIPIN